VRFRVQLGGILMMLGGMQMVAVRDFRVMGGLFVFAGLVVLGSLAMMLGRLLVVMRGFFVVLVDIAVVQILAVHRRLPGCGNAAASIAELR
jgi:hypothetical protein